jgi:hypothetical protein
MARRPKLNNAVQTSLTDTDYAELLKSFPNYKPAEAAREAIVEFLSFRRRWGQR